MSVTIGLTVYDVCLINIGVVDILINQSLIVVLNTGIIKVLDCVIHICVSVWLNDCAIARNVWLVHDVCGI